MSFIFKLDSPLRRVALIAAALLTCGVLGWLIYSHFILRAVTDPRLALAPETLAAASVRFPNSARVYYRLAEAEMGNAIDDQKLIPNALTHAERAVGLCLWDFKSRRLLGGLQELNGDQENAEKSLRAAVKLAPNHAETNWALANILLRRGKLNESFEPFRVATKTNDDLLPLAFELLFQSSGGDLKTLKAMAGDNPSAQLSLVQFFLDLSMTAEALNIFSSIDRNVKLTSPKSVAFIKSLMTAGRFDTARSIWLDLVSSPSNSSSQSGGQIGGLIWNGGFEADPVANLDHFDWTIAPTEYARIGIDTKVARNGSRSLRVAFAGRDTTKLLGEVRQLVVLRPGTRYRLECYAKAADLHTPEGPRIAVIGQGGVIAASEPVIEGVTDWRRLAVDFISPEDPAPKYIGLVRVPRFSYDDPTRGVVWFDDFTLVQQ